MKKILIALTIAISCLGISRVSADTYQKIHTNTFEYNCDFYVSDYDYLKKLGFEDEVQNLYNSLITVYNGIYSSQYPYYFFNLKVVGDSNCNYVSEFDKVGRIEMQLLMYSEKPVYDNTMPYASAYIYATYYSSNNTYSEVNINLEPTFFSSILFYEDFYNPLSYFISNFDLIVNSDTTFFISGNSNLTINQGDIIEPYYTADKPFQIDYTEINLNDYAYVILSLKNYEVEPFKTTIQVKGQFCPTPVYRLGTASSEEVFGTGVKDICTPYYDTYTPYSLSYYSDYLEKFAMLYVKAYDTTKDNYIKVDNRIFDITYVSEEEKDSPLVHYQGNTIQTIPYDKLLSTSTLNTQIGYVPDYGNSFSFDDIFTQPLKFLTSVWSTIVSFFSLITSFIALLPPELRGFLFASFSLGIALGLVKILIGAL